MRVIASLVMLTGIAAADPVATIEAPETDRPKPATGVEVKPSAGELAAAPPADEASGIVVREPRERHPIANTLLAVPRFTARVLLMGPRYAAGELDDYLESRSPNAFGRDVGGSSWRFGASAAWETALGPSLGVRVGRKLGDASADVYVAGLGPRGQSGGVRARYTGIVEPSLEFDAGRELERVFAGVGDRTARIHYEQDMLAVTSSLSARVGDFRFGAAAGFDTSKIRDAMTIGAPETERAGTGEVSVAFDTRRPNHRWIPRSAPSTGVLARAAYGYTRGTASTGDFDTHRGTLELRKLFDLFHGDRVLSFGARVDAVSDTTVPFDRLASLGGPERMRAFARDELRAHSTGYADIQYDWPLGSDSRGYLFVEGCALDPGEMHAGYGAGIRFLSGASTAARFQVAGSDTGDVGFLLQLGAL